MTKTICYIQKQTSFQTKHPLCTSQMWTFYVPFGNMLGQ